MGTLEGLQPESVFRFFEEISRIPHGSGNVGRISDYLKEFAEKRALFCVQDSVGNIVIVREAASGYEKEAPYILQAHMDMVAVAAPGYDIDMKKESLRLKVEDGKIYAEGTSLGGDDGIGMAYCLALLDAAELSMPRLEVVLTVDEETGMEGAKLLDLSMLRGNRMINLDQEEEGVFTTSCAGGARVEVDIPLTKEQPPEQGMSRLTVKVEGLLGGHSGVEIDKGRGNANWILSQLLGGVSLQYDIRLLHMEGGLADNAIPKEAEADVLIRESDKAGVMAYLEEAERKMEESLNLKETDPGFTVTKLFHNGTVYEFCFTRKSTANALACIAKLPNGVIAMSEDVEGLVETSLNLGVLRLGDGGLHLQYAVRSSIDQAKEELCRHMCQTVKQEGAEAVVKNVYPGWAYRKDSLLREKMVRVFERMYGKEPVLEAIHAGLECGILAGKIADLDCVSIGPDLENVHTAQERMSIASVERVWSFLVEVLTSRDE